MSREPHLRDYLTRDEVSALLRAAKKSPRYGTRNYAMILIAYRHGLRASELVNMRVSDLDLSAGTIYCRRAKGSRSSLHPMKPDEVLVLEEVLRNCKLQATEYVFKSERAEKLSRSAFWSDSPVAVAPLIGRTAWGGIAQAAAIAVMLVASPVAWAKSSAAHPYGADGHAKATGVMRESHGHIARSAHAKEGFRKTHPCPGTGKTYGAYRGYVIVWAGVPRPFGRKSA